MSGSICCFKILSNYAIISKFLEIQTRLFFPILLMQINNTTDQSFLYEPLFVTCSLYVYMIVQAILTEHDVTFMGSYSDLLIYRLYIQFLTRITKILNKHFKQK